MAPKRRKSSRRDFLRGKAAADAVADAAVRATARISQGGVAETDQSGQYTLRVSRHAMACEFEVCVNAGQYANDTEAALRALDLVDALEAQLTFFREDSELSHVNRTAGDHPVEVEPGLFELLELSGQLYEQTDGAFDITSTPLWEVWGFARREGGIPSDEQLAEARRLVGGNQVELEPEGRTVRFLRQGVRLNLGSIGKGYALDRCAELLHENGIEDYAIHGGNSSILARGRPLPTAGDVATAGWPVAIRNPLRLNRRLLEIRLGDRALATSGGRTQSFVHQGRRYSHILDPRTGQPAEGVFSATAIAPTAAMADALSTAFFVMGLQRTQDYCQEHPDVAAVMVCPGRGPGGFLIHPIRLTDEEMIVL